MMKKKKDRQQNPPFREPTTIVNDGSWLQTPGTIQQILIPGTLLSPEYKTVLVLKEHNK